MTVQMRLKGKYRSAVKGRYKGGENAAPKKKRSKLGHDRHVAMYGEPPKRHMVVDGKTGKARMEAV